MFGKGLEKLEIRGLAETTQTTDSRERPLSNIGVKNSPGA